MFCSEGGGGGGGLKLWIRNEYGFTLSQIIIM